MICPLPQRLALLDQVVRRTFVDHHPLEGSGAEYRFDLRCKRITLTGQRLNPTLETGGRCAKFSIVTLRAY